MKIIRMVVLAGCCAAFAVPSFSALGEVLENGPSGFALERTVHIAATPDHVYSALIQPSKWWNSAHTFSGNAANLSLEVKAGGCLCENWSGGSVQHLIVVYAMPGKMLRLRGALGPFQGQGMDGALTFTLKPDAGGTNLQMENVMGGFMKGGLSKWPPLADSMLAEQMLRLKAYVETGAPSVAPTK